MTKGECLILWALWSDESQRRAGHCASGGPSQGRIQVLACITRAELGLERWPRSALCWLKTASSCSALGNAVPKANQLVESCNGPYQSLFLFACYSFVCLFFEPLPAVLISYFCPYVQKSILVDSEAI